MSKTTWAWILVVVLVVGGYYTLKGSKSEPKENGTVQGENTSKKMAFSEFVKQGGSYKCEVKQSMNDFENSGTVYINGGNIRGEFTNIAEGKTINSSFISKDGYMYSWSSALPTMGFKMQVNPTGTSTGADASGTYSWNANQIGDYNCVAWTLDASKFELPAGITFKAVDDK